MLEVKNLTKIYKTKNGADVHALDGVSLQFAEKGMVFLLGKSGSGKSTLLNVCGGLDAPTSGEIIVKGRSSKSFSQSDFDSYRNTFIGFIFQEYNILNEFSVEDNIALALELQGKPKDKAAISALLEQVDLQGYAKRKPNTLSGGQKQRIAIARALVKSPEIIMADEPTGALDSNTGKQVFETLKKLSKDKLVLVVSHDREFAEQYGDRIIELKDGKVISDVSKGKEEQQKLSENVNAVGDVLCIKKGSSLTELDFDKIKAFLLGSKEDVIIANNGKDVANFKKVSRISDDGAKEVFKDTVETENKKQYTPQDSRFIRSKLPMRHAFKIGASGLKTKPIRLFFTVILCTVAFALFGLLSTLNFYNSEATFRQTLADTNLSVMQFEKQYSIKYIHYYEGEKQGEYDSVSPTKFTDAEMEQLASELGNNAFGALDFGANFNTRNSTNYYTNRVAAIAVLPEGNSLRENINGAYPKNKNEIVISSYSAEVLKNCGVYDESGAQLDLQQATDIIGKKVSLAGSTYTVTGIMNSGEVPAMYDVLKEDNDAGMALTMKYSYFLNDGLHLVVFVTPDRFNQFTGKNYDYKESLYNYTRAVAAIKHKNEFSFPDWGNVNYNKASEIDEGRIIAMGDNKMPSDNEVILSANAFANLICDEYYKVIDDINNSMKDNESDGSYIDTEKYYKITDLCNQIMQGGTWKYDEENKTEEIVKFTDAELKEKLKEVIKGVKRDKISVTLGLKVFDERNQSAIGEIKEFKVIGAYIDNYNGYNYAAISDTSFDGLWDYQKSNLEYYSMTETKYSESSDAVYNKIYVPYEYSSETIDQYWNYYNNKEFAEDDSRITLAGSVVSTLKMIDNTVENMSKIFLYVGLGFALFAVLLFSNFISVSISQKKREIGILRAVGARSLDVFKIFFSESFVIAAICVVLSAVGCFFGCSAINASLAEGLGASILVFGIPSILALIGSALITAIIATFLPVYNAARKKPVDSIRAL